MACRGPTPVSPPRALTIGLAAGLSTWLLGSEILTLTGIMTTFGAVVATVSVIAVSCVLIAWPGRTGLRPLAGRAVGAELAIAAVASIVVALPLLVMIFGRLDTLNGPTPWYYLDLARAIASEHGMPAHSHEWTMQVSFLADYPAFSSGTALLLVVGDADSLAGAQVVRVLTVVMVGAAAYLFARVVGAERSAAAVSIVLLFVSVTFVGKLASYRPEAT